MKHTVKHAFKHTIEDTIPWRDRDRPAGRNQYEANSFLSIGHPIATRQAIMPLWLVTTSDHGGFGGGWSASEIGFIMAVLGPFQVYIGVADGLPGAWA